MHVGHCSFLLDIPYDKQTCQRNYRANCAGNGIQGACRVVRDDTALDFSRYRITIGRKLLKRLGLQYLGSIWLC